MILHLIDSLNETEKLFVPLFHPFPVFDFVQLSLSYTLCYSSNELSLMDLMSFIIEVGNMLAVPH